MSSTRLLLIPEVAERLRVPASTLRYWRYLGEGPKSFRAGRRVVYREVDVEAWLEEQASVNSSRSR